MKNREERTLLRQARNRLLALAAESTPDGVSTAELAKGIFGEFPELRGILGPDLEDRWIRSVLRPLRDEGGLPLYGSFRGRALSMAHWTPDEFERRRDVYLDAALKNLNLAGRVAHEAQRVHGVHLGVPGLAWPDEDVG